MRVGRGDEAAEPARDDTLGRGEDADEEVVVAPLATPSASRPVLSGEVAIRTGTGASTSGDRTPGVTVTSTSVGVAGVGTPLAPVSAEVFSSVVVVAGGGAGSEAEVESFGDGGSGRDWRFDWLQREQTQSLDLLGDG